jgi:hypothetical protein
MAKKDPIKARQSEWKASLEIVKKAELERKSPAFTPDIIVDATARWLQRDLRGTVSNAFKYFGLDPQNVSDQAMLLAVLADVLFGGPGKGGRKEGSRFWNLTRLWMLGLQREEIIATQLDGMSDQKVAEEIIKRPEYKRFTPRMIRRQFSAARRSVAKVKEDFGAESSSLRLLRHCATLTK